MRISDWSSDVCSSDLDLSRTGDRSVYGDIEVTRPGVAEPLLVARGIAVYHEVTARTVSLRVPEDVAAKLKGPVRIRYSEDREIGGGTIDEAERVVTSERTDTSGAAEMQWGGFIDAALARAGLRPACAACGASTPVSSSSYPTGPP